MLPYLTCGIMHVQRHSSLAGLLTRDKGGFKLIWESDAAAMGLPYLLGPLHYKLNLVMSSKWNTNTGVAGTAPLSSRLLG